MMAKPVDTGVLQIPSVSARHRARFSDWQQGRGFHQGQRSPVPHIEAGHMTAPDRGASHQNALASTGPFSNRGLPVNGCVLRTAGPTPRGHGSLRGRRHGRRTIGSGRARVVQSPQRAGPAAAAPCHGPQRTDPGPRPGERALGPPRACGGRSPFLVLPLLRSGRPRLGSPAERLAAAPDRMHHHGELARQCDARLGRARPLRQAHRPGLQR